MNRCCNSLDTQKAPDNSWPGPTDEGVASQTCSPLLGLHLLVEFFDFFKDICELSCLKLL